MTLDMHVNKFLSKNTLSIFLLFLMQGLGVCDVWGQTNITALSQITAADGDYVITDDISGGETKVSTFSGTLTAQSKSDGTYPVISGISKPLFTTATDATISNIMFKEITVSGSGSIGAICGTASGSTRIYNCGVLPKYPQFNDDTHTETSTVSSSDGYCGSLVGQLSGNARVINCFSYATITGGTTVAGIVGYIGSTEITQDNVTTVPMVVNCMFYGEISGGSTKYPVYGGAMIKNDRDNGVNPYCYFRKNASFDNAYTSIDNYNRSWPAEEKNLTRFEYYRSILNSNKRLCTYWVTGKQYGSATDASTEEDEAKIAKWVLDPSIAPYPILKKWGKYPSVININEEKVWDPRTEDENGNLLTPHWVNRSTANEWEGKSYGTLTVYVNPGSHHTADQVTKHITITDMDTLNCDYGYYKIQLPYYNEVFGNPNGNTHAEKYGDNYTDYVVTGWDITEVDGSTMGTGTFEENWETGFNFADRTSTKKDLKSVSGRTFAQGGYYYVPIGVTNIKIVAHWGKAFYLANRGHNLDRVKLAASKNYKGDKAFASAGTISTFHGYTVYDDLQTIIQALDGYTTNSNDLNQKVCDQAIVLIGNHQVQNGGNKIGYGLDSKWHPHTIMSADLDFDNEPDYCLQLQFRNGYERPGIQPIRFDFLPVVELGLAVRSNSWAYAIGIFVPHGHFEITETAFMRTTQFEYDGPNNENYRISGKSPMILNGGEFELFNVRYHSADRTSYFLLGGNVWVHRFAPGAHGNAGTNIKTNLCAVNAIGGEFPEFYLSGIIRPDLAAGQGAPHCYTNGGKFGTMAGAGYDKVAGGVTFKINHSLINEFYGGGINGTKTNTIGGNIDVTIDNSRVNKYCGGPKVGDMTGKTVTTNATGTTFGVFYGGGNGGNSYYRQLQRDGNKPTSHIGTWTDDKYNWNGFNPLKVKDDDVENENKGYHAEYEFEVFNESNGVTDEITQRSFINWIQFGITITGDVESTLNNCKIKTNFYGGGNLATVKGNVTSKLNNTKVTGDVFGAGYSAAIPTFSIHDKNNKTFPSMDFAGTITDGSIEYVKDGDNIRKYEWTNDLYGKTVDERKASPAYQKDGKWYCYTWNKLENLGTVTGKAKLIINGEETVVEKSVYGGGEESAVGGDTEVEVNAGTIGVANAPVYEAIVGNVYGGGKGKDDDKLAGLVKGDTYVTISGSPMIYHNIYGGGAYGSVGEFDYDATGMPTGLKEGAIGGTCNVNITGGTIGTTGQSNGMVFGSSRGDVAVPGTDGVDPNDRLAWVNNTNVVIGTQSATPDLTQPLIRGSVYGSGENGHTYNNTSVTVHGGTIGIASGVEVEDEDHKKYVGARYPYRGNVYGGGCGTDTYEKTEVVTEDGAQVTKKYTYYNFIAGIVLGNTQVSIDGGRIVHNVYGGGAMGSVGTYSFNAAKEPIECAENTGLCTVTISGGDIGTDNMDMKAVDGPDDNGHVFGAGRGEVMDPVVCPIIENVAYYNNTEVTIKGKAFVRGSVFGGSESGHVLKDTHVIIGENNDSECQIGNGKGINRPYTSNEWATAETLEATNHWDYEDDGAPYDKNVRETGYYLNGNYAEGGKQVATDGHSFYGNVFGGGSGYYPYAQGKWLFSAGRVGGDTKVTINGGHILNNVYGGCEMSDVEGSATVTMSGGTVGVPRTKSDVNMNPSFGHVFGAGMGDKRIFFNTVTNVENTFVTVSGGRIYGSVHGGGEDGHVLKDTKTTISGNVEIGSNEKTELEAIFGYDGNVFGGGQGSPTALTAGTVGGNVELNILGGRMLGSVYGGGRIASVGPYFAMVTNEDGSPNPNYGKMQADSGNETHGHITVNLKGGTIENNVYGGCMGTRGMAAVDQVRFAVSKDVTVNLNENVANSERGCAVKGSIFGCNNVNSSPLGKVEVHIFKTQHALASQIAGSVTGEGAVQPKVKDRYDVKAVYGGGNMAAYLPRGPQADGQNHDGQNTQFSTKVIIDGCDETSIQQVYGGGNAASTPATEVTVNGAYEIGELFGGGNGKDKISYDGIERINNPGANVGFYEYEDNITEETATTDKPRTDTPEERAANYGYGSGEASVNIFGGYLHQVFGGSNTKGNVRKTAVTLLEEGSSCEFCVEEVYGGGKSAPMDAEAKLLMQCIPGLSKAYGGAEAADIQGGVTLNITNGTFDQVFGGNNKSGTIRGPIVVNIEETGCRPVIIGELYGGGNLAGYSVYGYKEEHVSETDPVTGEVKDVLRWVPLGKDPEDVLPSAPLYDAPVVNVKAFTSIGDIYGGGYGTSAVMVGNPTVNINVAVGSPETYPTTGDFDNNGFKEKTVTIEGYAQGVPSHTVTLPNHKKGNIGAINNVFGGGNAAKVVGKTTVNIGTRIGEFEYMAVNVKEGDPLTGEGIEYYTRSGDDYTLITSGTAVSNVTYYKKYEIKGVDIRGNVYGGGNQAEVTGDADVIIGKEN